MDLVLMFFGMCLCGILFIYSSLYYFHARRVFCKSDAKLTGKTVIITGGSRGIGKATALELAKRRAKVIIASRNQLVGEAAVRMIIGESRNTQVFYMPLDLANLDSVRCFADRIVSAENRLDVLINNAAISHAKELNNENGYDAVFATNYLGHFLLTHLLMDLLKKSAPCRVINVSSMSHSFVPNGLELSLHNEQYGDMIFPHLRGYDYSKLALVMHVKELARRFAALGVTAYAVHPSMSFTTLWDDMSLFWGSWYTRVAKILAWPLSMDCHSAAQSVIHCAVNKDLTWTTGKYYALCAVAKESAYARDPDLASRLWDVSLFLTGCTGNGRLVRPLNHIYQQVALDEETFGARKPENVDSVFGYSKARSEPDKGQIDRS